MEKIKILVVDDEMDFAETVSARLIKREFDASPVFSGKQAIEVVTNQVPDVIILDLKMPGINGLDVLRYIKKTTQKFKLLF